MGDAQTEREAIVKWLRAEAKRYERSDFAAWCTYFRERIERGDHLPPIHTGGDE